MKRIIGLLLLSILSLCSVVNAQTPMDGIMNCHRDGQYTGTFLLEGSSYQSYQSLTMHEDSPIRIVIKGDLPEYLYDFIVIRLWDENENWLNMKWETKTINPIGKVFEMPNLKAGKYILVFDGYNLDNIQLETPGLPDSFTFQYSADCRGLQYDLGSLHNGIYPGIRTSNNMDILSFGKIEGQELKVPLTTQPDIRDSLHLKRYDYGEETTLANEYITLEQPDNTHKVIRIAPELSGDISLSIMIDDRDSTTVLCPFTYTVECIDHSSFNKPMSTSGNASYIKTRTFLNPDGDTYLDEIQYFNGLGFPVQKVLKGITPARNNLIILQEYDGLGRMTKEWLPVRASSSIAYQEDEETIRRNARRQHKDIFPFTFTGYETSQRNEWTKLYHPGYAWNAHSYDRFSAQEKQANNEEILHFRINPLSEKLERSGNYPKGILQIKISADEDHRQSYEFKNTKGETLLIRQNNEGENADTYFVYDDFGNLRYVLPPVLLINTVDLDDDSEDMRRYAYLYRYDYRHRCIAKRLPGCGWMHYAYDTADRLIYVQDALQRQRKECSFSLTDDLGRNAVNGICSMIDTTSIHLPDVSQSEVKAVYTADEMGNMNTGYVFQNLNGIKDIRILSVNYYDNYNFLSKDSHFDDLGYNADGYGERYGNDSDSLNYCHKGLLTGNRCAILGTDSCIYNVMFYDKYHRCIQTQSSNHLRRNESNFYDYNYIGQIRQRLHAFSSHTSSPMEDIHEYSYDHAGRLTDVYYQPFQTINGALISMENAHLAEIRYDEYGKQEIVINHDSWGNTTSYEYNIRGWLTHSHGDCFEQRLQYESPLYGASPCYNGNISCMEWKANKTLVRGYKFKYDGLNRLTSASYAEGDSLKHNTGRFDEEITGYDKAGNILGLKRYGQTSETGYGIIDNLAMTYDGNRLINVADSITTPVYGNGMEFEDGTNQSVEYRYDVNGNLIQDLNRKIIDIQYNCLNLPNKVQFEDGNCISYLYAADGQKLRTTHIIGNDTTTTDYCNQAIYENGILTKILNDYGYLSLSPDTAYHYFTYDHQGNIRAVVSPEREVKEINHYYPFGGLFSSSNNPVQPYKYNGKELDRKNGLNWYDYGARMYDPMLGRWHTVDPMAEKYYSASPYNYCGNNPVNGVDPDGMDYWSTSNQGEIERFIEVLCAIPNAGGSITDSFNFSSWNHSTDSEFLSDLTFNDETNIFYSSYGTVENGIATRVGVSMPALGRDNNSAWIEGAGSRWYKKASGRAENVYPEFDLLALGRGLVNLASKVGQYTKSNLKLGQEMHKAYHQGQIGKEFRLPSGRRIDYLDMKKKIIYELKPNNPRAIKQGNKQLLDYLEEIQNMPRFKGIKWKTKLETY